VPASAVRCDANAPAEDLSVVATRAVRCATLPASMSVAFGTYGVVAFREHVLVRSLRRGDVV